MDQLLMAAAQAGVRLGIEPEPGNVVRDASTAAQLLDELRHDAPNGIVLNPANLLSPQTLSRQSEILAHAVDLLGPSVISIQAKDVVASGHAAAGAGLMDHPGALRFKSVSYLRLVRGSMVVSVLREQYSAFAEHRRTRHRYWTGRYSSSAMTAARAAASGLNPAVVERTAEFFADGGPPARDRPTATATDSQLPPSTSRLTSESSPAR